MSNRAASWRSYLLPLPAWVTLVVFFVAPLAIMVLLSFGRWGNKPIDDLAAYLRTGEFLRSYRESLDWVYLEVLWRSLWIALATTLITLLISYPAAYYIAFCAPPRWKNLLLVLAVVPFWTSFLIRTYAWHFILHDAGLVNTALQSAHVIREPLPLLYNNFAILLGLVYGELPFMILPIYASLEKLDRTLLEAASDLGAGRWRAFCRVTLPLSAPGAAAGVLLVFIPSVGQFIVSDMMGGARYELIGNVIYRQFTVGRDKAFGAALALELTAMVLAMLIAYGLFVKRRGGTEELL